MLLSPTLVGQSVNGYTGLDLSGHLGLGNFTNLPGGPPPLTMIHLDNLGTEVAGYRPWMHTGVGMSDASEWMYVGMKRESADRQDAVINWSDNREVFSGGQFGPDALRMIFTSTPTTTSVSGSVNGLEIARLIPAVSGNEGFFGIGDYFTAGLQPVERLDILNGRLRIRPLPTDPPMTSEQFMVVDNTGVVGWRNLGTLPDNCEWRFQSSTNLNVITASGTLAGCPGDGNNVGIGVNPSAKLHVLDRPGGAGGTVDIGLKVDELGQDGENQAVQIYNNRSTGFLNSTGTNTGISMEVWNALDQVGLEAQVRRGSGLAGGSLLGVSANCTSSQPVDLMTGLSTVVSANGAGASGDIHGVRARAELNNGTADEVFGVYGMAATSLNGSAAQAFYGVYGTTTLPSSTLNGWAGYFNGRTYVGGTIFTPSDVQLKENVEELNGALEQLALLQPKRYSYRTDQYPQLNLPEGERFGFLAQEVGEHFPKLVTPVHHPAEHDSLGNEIQPAVDFLGLSTTEMIPLLVASVNEQQVIIMEQAASIQEQARRLDQLEAALAACCAATPGDTRLFTTPPANTPDDLNKALEGDARHLHIQPNPFTERTTLHYRLERAGRMQLLANSADGKALKVLQDATLEAGAYQFNWETNELTPGVYYVTLLLDGEPLVKKAVKVMR
ncbi:MAG: tail fiber domain-containing protein [Flavobacteriales bacterium]|nr:tail fiber domain-containing protein [Flavobacteriales bacterium]